MKQLTDILSEWFARRTKLESQAISEFYRRTESRSYGLLKSKHRPLNIFQNVA